MRLIYAFLASPLPTLAVSTPQHSAFLFTALELLCSLFFFLSYIHISGGWLWVSGFHVICVEISWWAKQGWSVSRENHAWQELLIVFDWRKLVGLSMHTCFLIHTHRHTLYKRMNVSLDRRCLLDFEPHLLAAWRGQSETWVQEKDVAKVCAHIATLEM